MTTSKAKAKRVLRYNGREVTAVVLATVSTNVGAAYNMRQINHLFAAAVKAVDVEGITEQEAVHRAVAFLLAEAEVLKDMKQKTTDKDMEKFKRLRRSNMNAGAAMAALKQRVKEETPCVNV